MTRGCQKDWPEEPLCEECDLSWKDKELVWIAKRWLCHDDIHKLGLVTPP